MNQMARAELTDPACKRLYKLGGVAAWLVVVLTLSEVVSFIFYPQPGSVEDWFTLFQGNPWIGLLDFWGLEVPMYVMFAVAFLALYVVLRKVDAGWMAIALAFALLGIGIFLATNNPFSMLSLSKQYAATTTDAQRSALLAAGHTLLANTGQRAVGGFNVGLFLVSVAGLITSSVMLRSRTFSRTTAHLGILAYALSLADYVRQALTTSEVIALLVILPGALLLVTWFGMVGRNLHRLGRT
jgi:Na+/melibiose symporter-like transporter